ncbi:biotin synthase auxiliary protein BsaP [Sphaerimonospora cavernae]|uniref:biotin synthase auxiliary protein BsaP n=1 Tax=Sphaerimonospora cavernae TaxID=1740611 RepID=UPI00406C3E89
MQTWDNSHARQPIRTPSRSGRGSAPDEWGDIISLYCDHCGRPAAEGDHAACRTARAMEPPRFCPHCRRRMVGQVAPTSWSARCSKHGDVGG